MDKMNPSDCNFVVVNGVATCLVCGYFEKTKERDGSRIHRPCGNANIKIAETDRITISTPHEKPKTITKVKNFTKAAIKHLIAGMPTCTQEQIDERHLICAGDEAKGIPKCPLFRKSDNNPSVGVCDECGCNITKEVQYLNKLAMATEECPKGKWPKLG